MASQLGDCCPICLGSREEPSYVLPCLHQFCYTCILRWAESKPECPLCKRRVSSILHSVRADDDFQEHVISAPVPPSVVIRQRGGRPGQAAALRLRQTAPARPAAALPWAPEGGFHALLFRRYPTALQPLLPWLQQELGQLFEDAQEAAAAQSLITSSLRQLGLDEEAMTQRLQASLGRHTTAFVERLMEAVVRRCSGVVPRGMRLGATHAARGQEEGAPVPAASRGGSPAPSPALRGGPGGPPCTTVPTRREQEEAQEEAEETAAGPSSQPQPRARSPEGPRRAPKRRADSPEDPSQPPRKPPRHR